MSGEDGTFTETSSRSLKPEPSQKSEIKRTSMPTICLKESLEENIQGAIEDISSKTNCFSTKSRRKLKTKHEDCSSSSDSSFGIEGDEQEEIDLETCSTRDYIERTVGEILLTALTILERERPEEPIKWLAAYLLFHKDDRPDHKDHLYYEDDNEVKLPENVKKIILEDAEDLDIIGVGSSLYD